MNSRILPFTVYPKKTTIVVFIALSAVFVAGGVLMITDGQAMGWLCAGFFGVCLLVFATQLHPKSSFLTVSDQGLEFSSLFRRSVVRWSDIDEFGVYSIRQHGLRVSSFVGINYSAEYVLASKARAVSKALVGFEGGLPDTYGYSAEDLAQLLAHFHSEKIRNQTA